VAGGSVVVVAGVVVASVVVDGVVVAGAVVVGVVVVVGAVVVGGTDVVVVDRVGAVVEVVDGEVVVGPEPRLCVGRCAGVMWRPNWRADCRLAGVTGTEVAASVPPMLATWLAVMAIATATPPPMPSRRARRLNRRLDRACSPCRRHDAGSPVDHSERDHSACSSGGTGFFMGPSFPQRC
jgi:hypothetical protein